MTTEPQLISREQLLSRGNDRRTKIVDIPGLGNVKIRNLKEDERAEFESDTLNDDCNYERERLITAKRRLIIACVVDANCEPILNAGDVKALGEKDGAIVAALYEECAAFSGITKTDLAELVGNSSGARGGDSP